MPHRYLSTFALASALLVSAYASAAVTDTSLPLNTWWDGAKPTANDRTWVNALFRDFSGADPLGNFEWIRNTIELQITTDSLTHARAHRCRASAIWPMARPWSRYGSTLIRI